VANILWSPQPKQAEALSCPAFEMLYGGAAGGGKTDFLIIDFLGLLPQWGGPGRVLYSGGPSPSWKK
jgi:hypothetical protein